MRRVVYIVTGVLQAALGVWLALATIPKVTLMAQVGGWIPGARHIVVRVADKAHISFRGRDGYWISWGDGDVRVPGNHRLSLRESEWVSMRIGDQFEVIYAGTDRFNVYYRGSVFNEPGNWVLDGVLLLIEVLLVWFGARRIIRAAGYAASVV